MAAFILTAFSTYCEMRWRMVSRIPPVSPASIMLVVRSSKIFGIGAQGIGQSCTALDRSPDAQQSLLENRVLLVVAEDFQTLHQGKTGVNHHRELTEEDGLLLGLDRTATDLEVEVASGALLLDYVCLNTLARQRGAEYLLIFSSALALHLFARSIVSLICKNRHSEPLCSPDLKRYLRAPAPVEDLAKARLIISCSSSGFEERNRAVSMVMAFCKYRVISD